jgi:predicted dehydrogenase
MTDGALRDVELPPCEPFYDDTEALWAAFVAHVREGAPLHASGADHLITLGLCFAAIESSASGRTIDFAAYCREHGIQETPTGNL